MSDSRMDCTASPLDVPARPLPARPPHRMARRVRVGPSLALALSAALLFIGSRATHDVRVMDAQELARLFDFDLEPFDTISDRQLLIDATFTGVVRKDGRLYSTYDRMAPPMKRACPT